MYVENTSSPDDLKPHLLFLFSYFFSHYSLFKDPALRTLLWFSSCPESSAFFQKSLDKSVCQMNVMQRIRIRKQTQRDKSNITQSDICCSYMCLKYSSSLKPITTPTSQYIRFISRNIYVTTDPDQLLFTIIIQIFT